MYRYNPDTMKLMQRRAVVQAVQGQRPFSFILSEREILENERRRSPAFQELERMAESYRPSFRGIDD